MRAISEKRKIIEERGHKPSLWKRCRWRLHIENIPWLFRLLNFFIKITFRRPAGLFNALDVKTEEIEIAFKNLPKAFDNTRILLITDLHIDGCETLAEKIISAAEKINYDYCILGGDYSFGKAKPGSLAYLRMKELATRLAARSRIFAVLGNHDRYSIAEVPSECEAGSRKTRRYHCL